MPGRSGRQSWLAERGSIMTTDFGRAGCRRRAIAHSILDRVRAGQGIEAWRINLALRVLGDLPGGDPGHRFKRRDGMVGMMARAGGDGP